LTRLSERSFRVLSGLIAVLLATSTVVLGGKLAYGASNPVYHVTGTFSSAGQGLLPGSDVKIHGVNIGKVSSIKLVDGRARIRLTIKKSETIPVASEAVIRPKTLFGEKFIDVDPGATEATGPFLRDGDTIKKTQGGFEVERVLTDLYPILKEINPEELGTILDELARGGVGVGSNVNHALQSLTVFASGQAKHVGDTQRFLDDLAALSDTLAAHADEAVAATRDAHDVLPSLNAHASEFTDLLRNTSRLSGDLADVLEANKGLLTKAVTQGGKTLDVVDAQKQRLPAVIIGLRQFLQTLAEAGTGVPYGDGALAKIKLVLGGECQQLLADCSDDLPNGYSTDPTKTQSVKAPTLPVPTKGIAGLRQLLEGLVG
jgi:phospholipid/cholesterol/gamma-HCH transport system substrate-binding protein